MYTKEEQEKALRERMKRNVENREGTSSVGKQVLDWNVIGGWKKELIYKPKSDPKLPALNRFDILPWLVSIALPEGMPIGMPDYILDVWVHRFVGPSKGNFICLQKMFNKPCPICEEREALRNTSASDDEIKKLYPQKRCYYNVVNIDLPENEQKVQIFEAAYNSFESELRKEVAIRGEIIDYTTLSHGQSIEFRSQEITSPKGKYNEFTRFNFLNRQPYTEDIYKSVYPLDKMLVVPAYEEVRNAFYGTDDSYAPAQQETPKQEAQMGGLPRARQSAPQPTPAPEAVPQRVRTRPQPIDTPSVPEDTRCPKGFRFGVDTDNKQECSTCPETTWNLCSDEREIAEKIPF